MNLPSLTGIPVSDTNFIRDETELVTAVEPLQSPTEFPESKRDPDYISKPFQSPQQSSDVNRLWMAFYDVFRGLTRIRGKEACPLSGRGRMLLVHGQKRETIVPGIVRRVERDDVPGVFSDSVPG